MRGTQYIQVLFGMFEQHRVLEVGVRFMCDAVFSRAPPNMHIRARLIIQLTVGWIDPYNSHLSLFIQWFSHSLQIYDPHVYLTCFLSSCVWAGCKLTIYFSSLIFSHPHHHSAFFLSHHYSCSNVFVVGRMMQTVKGLKRLFFFKNQQIREVLLEVVWIKVFWLCQ